MAPIIPSAKTTLTYPLYACDFDPLDSTRLVVGGGGGAGRSGVGNKITLLNTSKDEELEEVTEIDLSKDEDSVMSLAVGPCKGTATLIFAGVNSSPQQIEKGKNQHLRIFGIESVGKAKKGLRSTSSCKIAELSRVSLFQGSESDSYQRIVRLSKPFPKHSQLGAVATGLGKNSEVVLFDTSSKSPSPRGGVQSNREAADVDVLQAGKNEYFFAYCNEHEVFLKTVSSKTDSEEPNCIYTIPGSDSAEKPRTPTFRAMRWLTKDFLLMLTNIYGQGGVVLQILRLPSDKNGQCRIAQSHRLPSSVAKATALAVVNLTPPLEPDDAQGYIQFVISVAGHNRSVSLFKVDLQQVNGNYLTSPIKPFRILKDVHPLQITSLAFSNFAPPTEPITASTPPQHLKLASVGISNTVIVHTLPLFPVPFSVKTGQSKTPRYVIALPSSGVARSAGIITSLLFACLIAFIVQNIIEIRGVTPSYLGATDYIPRVFQEAIGKPYSFPDDYDGLNTPARPRPQNVVPPSGFFEELRRKEGDHVVFIQDTAAHETNPELIGQSGVKATLLKDGEQQDGGIKWEELSERQKEGWKCRLKEAGHYVEEMGETVLQGVIFGELAGAVGHAIGG